MQDEVLKHTQKIHKAMNSKIYSIILIFHVISGFSGLLSGTFAMMKTNSIKTHKKAGKVFFYSMLSIFITSTIMCFMKTNIFLLLVGFFSFYMAATGYRILKLKTIHKNDLKPTLLDFLISFIGIFGALAIFILAYTLFQSGSNFGYVCLFFGAISLFFGITDFRKFYITISDKFYWMRAHSIRMAGAYAATVTAFVVVNIQIKQGWILWILPAFIVIPIAFRLLNNKIKQFSVI